MPYAILKLSYNSVGDTQLEGGICGAAFFVDNRQALTANHVLSSSNFKPNKNYSKCQYWLISRQGQIISIERENLVDRPEIDVTIIKFGKPQPSCKIYALSDIPVKQYESVACKGYVGDFMPVLETGWAKNRFEIRNADLSNAISDRTGLASAIKILDINADDIKLKNIKGIELSFSGVVGMSGGPLVSMSTGKAVGIMSVGLPAGSKRKTTLLAVSADEIIKVIGKN